MTSNHFTHNGLFSFRGFLFLLVFWLSTASIFAEGSKDINQKPGKRLFLYAYDPLFAQQMKVFAKNGEFINVGASHVGIKGGFIKVYSPSGALKATFDAATGDGIINNNVEEDAGPTGGGSLNGTGYKPGIVSANETGVWTVHISYPEFSFNQDWKSFTNLEVGQAWTRDANQPKDFRRVVLAWDITVSQNGTGNETGSKLLKGRVYSNELSCIINDNNNNASPTYYVLSQDGFKYQIDFLKVDPWGFPFHSNNTGIVNDKKQPLYKSLATNSFKRVAKISEMVAGSNYLYEPQARDTMGFVNNKVFINPPADDLPQSAKTTDIFRNDTHTTWLLNEIVDGAVMLSKFEIKSTNVNCGTNVIEANKGASFEFTSNASGTGTLLLDLNNNGSFIDPEDVKIIQAIVKGKNKIAWDGKLGNGTTLKPTPKFAFNYKFSMRGGEIHIMMNDVENNPGGTKITRLNGIDAPANDFFYDHSVINGGVSGGGTPGNPNVTTEPYTYMGTFGNDKLLDYWTYVNLAADALSNITVEVSNDCNVKPIDTDQDGIPDEVDLDDDNDGVSDIQEFCNLGKNFACLPNGSDPSADDDLDRIPNYKDAINLLTGEKADCIDGNNDGVCDLILAVFDIDGDNVPDHLDLDSDNDGITDLNEAGHSQPDINQDGVIDGLPSIFGINGLYDPLDKNPASFTEGSKYTPWDTDADNVPDHDDLDSDNDGIHDVKEAGYDYEISDANGDGRIDFSSTKPVDANGLCQLISPITTKNPIGYPKDFDGDGIPDWHDLDSDNDGINDVEEANIPDPDNDGIIGNGKPTVNPNGVATADSTGKILVTTSFPVDTDKDGVPDWHDYDSDNDGIKDVIEAGFTDPDNDGQVGKGKPIVNAKGQPKDANTSNPPDFDGDGIEDFRDTECSLTLEKPLIITENEVCPNASITLFAQSNYPMATQFIWINTNGDTIAKTGKTLTINENDEKNITFYSVMVSWNGCKSKFSDPVGVKPKSLPNAASLLAINDTIKVATNGVYTGSLTQNDKILGVTYTAFVKTQPKNGTVSISESGIVTYKPTNDYRGADEFEYALSFDGCESLGSKAKVIVDVFAADVKACFIPNIITPNEDGDNDTFFIPCAESYPDGELTVYNRLGSQVFSSRNYKNDWAGTYNGDSLPAGTYYYTYKLKPTDTDCQIGYLTIIRE